MNSLARMSNAARQLEVLLACFRGHKRAGQVHGRLDQQLEADGPQLLDEVVYWVTPKGKARVYDPRRTLAGTLIPAVTWGVFGLLTSGTTLPSFVASAVIGAVCGGLWAYTSEHLLTKRELSRLGKRLSPGSSAILAYVVGADPSKLAATAASFEPAVASVATIGADLSATVLDRIPHGPPPDSVLRMLVFRYPGQDTAKAVNATAKGKKQTAVETELLIAADKSGGFHVASPTARAFVRSDVVAWGVFGLVFGAVACFRGSRGLLGALENGVITGIGWALFGLLAGALYGLWAGRAVSARRLRTLGPLLPPDTSMVLAWAEGALPQTALAPWSAPGSQQLTLRFNRVPDGAVLDA